MQAITQLIENGRLALRLMNDPRVQKWVRYGIPIFVVLYFIMPFDVIPDFIPGFGQLDDLTVIVLGMRMMARFAPSYVVDEHKQALGYDVTPRVDARQEPRKDDYWNMPPVRGDGKQATRTAPGERPIDGEYKVVRDR